MGDNNDIEIMDLYIAEMNKYPLLTDKETQELLRRYKLENDIVAFKELVNHNLRLAYFKALKFKNKCKTMGFLDLIQESNIILMKAIKLFDMNVGVKFSTYIGVAMEKSLQRQIDSKNENIKISVRVNEAERKYYKYVSKYLRDYAKYPTREQIIANTRLSEGIIDDLERLCLFRTVSLNVKLPNYENEEIIDTIVDERDDYSEVDSKYDELIFLRVLYNVLDIRDYYIIYNNVIKSPGKTQEEIGKEIELTRVSVNRREANALKKLKSIFLKDQLNQSLNNMNKIFDDRMLVPIEPKLKSTLLFLKENLSELEYYIAYTKLCDIENDSINNYYKRFNYENLTVINSTIMDMDRVVKIFISDDNIDQIYNFYRNKLTVAQILELDVLPEGKVRSCSSNKSYYEIELINKMRSVTSLSKSDKGNIQFIKSFI